MPQLNLMKCESTQLWYFFALMGRLKRLLRNYFWPETAKRSKEEKRRPCHQLNFVLHLTIGSF